jgi:hypothetical protein
MAEADGMKCFSAARVGLSVSFAAFYLSFYSLAHVSRLLELVYSNFSRFLFVCVFEWQIFRVGAMGGFRRTGHTQNAFEQLDEVELDANAGKSQLIE